MALIWNGEQIPCEAHVIDWRSSGLRFNDGANGCHARRKAPKLLLIHFTGAENPPPVMFANMQKTVRSVEFGMDYYGQIWQFADPAKIHCAHAEGANTFSFGIEIQNRGVPTPLAATGRFPRGTYVEQMPWGRQAYTFFTAAQLEELEKLIDALTDAKVLPAKLAVAKKDIRKRIPKAAWSSLRGVAGHYHCDTDPGKIDPGPQVFDELWEHFND
jgi:N-acetyl-anhydromuramyl-L-alanine amidase AmpD